ncbi:hypothetical protein [Stieleria sp. JC731]|nr:hypothetical protein [Stieleria sp. JC731]
MKGFSFLSLNGFDAMFRTSGLFLVLFSLLILCSASRSVANSPPSPIFMVGDGGLLQPILVQTAIRTYAIQQHASRISENNSVIPQDRIGMQFNRLADVHMGNVLHGVGPGQFSVQRYKNLQEYRLTIERSFHANQCSWEIIAPIYRTSDNHIIGIDEILRGPDRSVELGEFTVGLKSLLWYSHNTAWSAGLRIEAPTTRDIRIGTAANSPQTLIEKEAWYFTPWIGGQWNSSSDWYVTSFLSARLNSEHLDQYRSTAGGQYSLIDQPEYLFLDSAVGKNLVTTDTCLGTTNIASSFELHYATALDSTEPSNAVNNSASGTVFGRTDYLNLTAAISVGLGNRLLTSTGFAVPLRKSLHTQTSFETDRTYDWAFFFQLNVLQR